MLSGGGGAGAGAVIKFECTCIECSALLKGRVVIRECNSFKNIHAHV